MNADETERYPSLLTQRQLMRQAVDAGMPVLGICLGAQLLARALDAPVYRAPVTRSSGSPYTSRSRGHPSARRRNSLESP